MLFWILVHIFWVILWPLINMVKSYFAEGQYATAIGEDKTAKHLILQAKGIQSVRAHMFEVCLESSFQPILQIYLILPCFIQSLICIDLDTKKFDFTSLQFFAILTSVLSLTFSFTKYFVMKQKGAMDFGFSPLAYSIILLATLFQVYLNKVFEENVRLILFHLDLRTYCWIHPLCLHLWPRKLLAFDGLHCCPCGFCDSGSNCL